MKRTLAIIMSVLVLFAFASCDNTPEVKEFNVTIDLDYEGAPEPAVLAKQTMLTAPETPEREGFILDYWSLNEEKVTVWNTPLTGDVTLKAVWKQTYTVTLDFGYDGDTSQEKKNQTNLRKPDDPSRDGYVFLHWTLSDMEVTEWDTPLTGNVTIVAVWGLAIRSEADFTVKSDLNPVFSGNPTFIDPRANTLNGEYVLESDIDVEHMIYIPEDATVTLDLNGHKITSSFEGFAIGNFGTMTINDSSEDKTGIVCTICKTFGNGNYGHDSVRNFGNLTINGGTYGDCDLDRTNANDDNYGAGFRNQPDATATINGGYFSAGDNYWNEKTGEEITWSYAVRNQGTLTVNDWTVYGKMNGGFSAEEDSVNTLNGGVVEVLKGTVQTFYCICTYEGSTVDVKGGEYKNYGVDLIYSFGARKVIEPTATDELAAQNINITGGKFYKDGELKADFDI